MRLRACRLNTQSRKARATPSSDLWPRSEASGTSKELLDRLNKVAPPPIEGDMNTVDGDFHIAISDSGSAAAGLLLGDPTGLAKILFDELIHVNSYRHVDQFAAANCGTRIFGA